MCPLLVLWQCHRQCCGNLPNESYQTALPVFGQLPIGGASYVFMYSVLALITYEVEVADLTEMKNVPAAN